MTGSKPNGWSGRYCVVIPAYNVEGTIGDLVRRAKLQGLQVLVVDDGSRDRTAALASQHGALVISHLQNQGKGSALRTGFAYALRSQFDGVVTMDADGQHVPEDIPKLVKAGEVQHAGIVLGNRMADSAAMPPSRRWANRLMSTAISMANRQQIPDSQCGFRFIRKEVLASVPLRSDKFEIETELLMAASKQKWKTVSVPVQTVYDKNQASHIRPVRDFLRFAGVFLTHLFR